MHGRDACQFSIYIKGGKNVRWINFLLDKAKRWKRGFNQTEK